MAVRPFAFGVRLRDRERDHTARVVRSKQAGKWVVEDQRRDGQRRREHTTLGGALRDLASSWRSRLH
jgi:hypothetical protein